MSETEKQKIIDFTSFAGIIFQMVNDISDLVPSEKNAGTKTKSGEDAFSDFKNQNITLPIALHLCSEYGSEIWPMLKEKRTYRPYFKLDENYLCNAMLSSGSIQSAREVTAKIKRMSLSYLNETCKQFVFLKDCMAIASHNKFYGALEKIDSTRSQFFQTSPKRLYEIGIPIVLSNKIRGKLAQKR